MAIYFFFEFQVDPVGVSWVGASNLLCVFLCYRIRFSLTPKAALFKLLLRPQVSNRLMKVNGSDLGHGKANDFTCLVCWVVVHDLFCVLGRFAGCEVGGSLTPKTALFALLLRPQVSKRPMDVS